MRATLQVKYSFAPGQRVMNGISERANICISETIAIFDQLTFVLEHTDAKFGKPLGIRGGTTNVLVSYDNSVPSSRGELTVTLSSYNAGIVPWDKLDIELEPQDESDSRPQRVKVTG